MAAPALKFAAGRYYYVIASGGGILDGVNPNANYQEQYNWNDANGDRHFQPGEQTGAPVVTRVMPETISVDPDYLRPYTDEYTGGVDHELLPVAAPERRLYPSRRAQSAGDIEPCESVRHVPDDARGHRARRRRRHGRRHDVPVLQPHVNGGEPDVLHERPDLPPDLRRPRDHRHQAHVEPLADARRLHLLADAQVEGFSVNIYPNALINADRVQ